MKSTQEELDYAREWYKNNQNILKAKRKKYYEEHRESAKKRTHAIYERYFNRWMEIFKENGYKCCLHCGASDQVILTFHHVDKSSKKFSIGNLLKKAPIEKNIKLILDEAKKCIMLCASCHTREHYRLRHLND